jgi:hypothetical protein
MRRPPPTQTGQQRKKPGSLRHRASLAEKTIAMGNVTTCHLQFTIAKPFISSGVLPVILAPKLAFQCSTSFTFALRLRRDDGGDCEKSLM